MEKIWDFFQDKSSKEYYIWQQTDRVLDMKQVNSEVIEHTARDKKIECKTLNIDMNLTPGHKESITFLKTMKKSKGNENFTKSI